MSFINSRRRVYLKILEVLSKKTISNIEKRLIKEQRRCTRVLTNYSLIIFNDYASFNLEIVFL